MMTDKLAAKLLETIQSYQAPLLVAFSGGVDSTVVAKAATIALGREKVLCVAARSESNTSDDIELCRNIARDHNLALRIVEYSELAIPNYAENPSNRCYFCKNELYSQLGGIADSEGAATIVDGSNADDVGDYRPGLKAVQHHGVKSPLKESGITKDQVRQLAKHWNLPNHDKPSAPCLSSRIPYGDMITEEKLIQVSQAENQLRMLGLSELRVRHHGDIARIEVPKEDFQTVINQSDLIAESFRLIGFKWVSLDLAGFKSGGLNALLDQTTVERQKSSQVGDP